VKYSPWFLVFEFRDAIPFGKCVVERRQDENFHRMVKHIKAVARSTKRYVEDLQTFTVWVSDPNWVSDSDVPPDEEDEDW